MNRLIDWVERDRADDRNLKQKEWNIGEAEGRRKKGGKRKEERRKKRG